MKLGTKFLVLVVITVLVLMNRKKENVANGAFWAICGLTLTNAAIAVLWRSADDSFQKIGRHGLRRSSVPLAMTDRVRHSSTVSSWVLRWSTPKISSICCARPSSRISRLTS